MFFKSLEIHGFKSFADKTVLNFDAQTTAVVGSNGNGKSNISDALRWVMGEQGAKTLRGEKMEDVIFHGTTDRKPMGFAKVALTIDNTHRALPVDADEVTISRKLYRKRRCLPRSFLTRRRTLKYPSAQRITRSGATQ